MNIENIELFLKEQGYSFSKDSSNNLNQCGWYAYKRSDMLARPCECNDNKQIQLVIYPYKNTHNGNTYESLEVDITGEYKNQWFKLSCYSLSPLDFYQRHKEIETSLINAWNALAN